jgi:RNA polymerase sigma-70 factor (ECF subfamily)
LVQDALRALPEPFLTTLVLHSCDFRYDEIAAMTGVTLGTVASRLSRAREQLRVNLLRHWPGGPASATYGQRDARPEETP